MRKTGKILVISLLLAVIAVFAMAGCKKEEKASAAPYDGAVKLLEDSYNGDLNSLDKLAPADVWNYLQRQGLNVAEYKAEINRQQTEFIQNIQKQYGKDAKICISTGNAKICGEETLDNIRTGLRKVYGIQSNTVKAAYTMKRGLTVNGTAQADYEGQDILAVNISDQWYLLYDHSKEENPIFYFPYLSEQELNLD